VKKLGSSFYKFPSGNLVVEPFTMFSAIAQYYNFIRLGRKGYQRIHQTCQDIAMNLSKNLEDTGVFEILHDGHCLPVLCFKLKDPDNVNFTVFDLSDRLRMMGWQVPAYSMPENLTNLSVMRVVVREGMSRELATLLMENIIAQLEYFAKLKDKNDGAEHSEGFHH
jgi:glutamate decarboxylase